MNQNPKKYKSRFMLGFIDTYIILKKKQPAQALKRAVRGPG
jgi:hypothetical protein